ncbi:unnamed protein product [Acanthosepion pharaonis]|uniref:Uncharacterized protein n=1 Tax=Acanthosepion pharaonis TaxID=158019 RepID=A0A812DSN6_ACAPH|nr:unnamed protein product [Sepia pharaonis]
MQKLPSDMMDEISDVLSDLREHEPYDHLKEAILKRTGRSEEDMIQEILRNVTRGDKTPSQLLRYMRNQLGKHNVSEKVLRAKHERYEPSKTERALADLQRQIQGAPDLPAPADEDIDPISTETNPSRERRSDQVFVGFIAHSAMGPGIVNLPVHTRRPGETNKPGESRRLTLPVPTRNVVYFTHIRRKDPYSEYRHATRFHWTFTVANVKVPILGADFLAHYALAVHMNPRTLSDTTTNLRVLGTPTRQGSTGISVATCHGREYLDLLTQFTDITLPLQVTASDVFKPTSPFVEELRHKMARQICNSATATGESYIPQHLRDCKFVFVRNDAVRRPLTPAYQGPFQVLRRTDKHLTIKRANSTDTIAIDRTKPAFLEKRQYDANPALRPLMLFQRTHQTQQTQHRRHQTTPQRLLCGRPDPVGGSLS